MPSRYGKFRIVLQYKVLVVKIRHTLQNTQLLTNTPVPFVCTFNDSYPYPLADTKFEGIDAAS